MPIQSSSASKAQVLDLQGSCLVIKRGQPTLSVQHLASPTVVVSKVSVATTANSGGNHSGNGVGGGHLGKQGLLAGSLQGSCTAQVVGIWVGKNKWLVYL